MKAGYVRLGVAFLALWKEVSGEGRMVTRSVYFIWIVTGYLEAQTIRVSWVPWLGLRNPPEGWVLYLGTKRYGMSHQVWYIASISCMVWSSRFSANQSGTAKEENSPPTASQPKSQHSYDPKDAYIGPTSSTTLTVQLAKLTDLRCKRCAHCYTLEAAQFPQSNPGPQGPSAQK